MDVAQQPKASSAAAPVDKSNDAATAPTAVTKQAADQQAAGAALSRIASDGNAQQANGQQANAQQANAQQGGDTATIESGPLKGSKVGTATAMAHVDLQAPVEAVITSVSDQGFITCNITARIPLAAIHAESITPEELAHVVGVEDMGGAGGDHGAQLKLDGDSIEVTLIGAPSTNSINANGFKLLLADGKSVALTVTAHQYHVDETEWQRATLRQDIKNCQDTIDTFQKAALEDQKVVDQPPPPDDAKEKASLAAASAQADALNQKIAARTQQLEGEWQGLDPTTRATTLDRLGGTNLAQQAQQIESLAGQRGTLQNQQLDLSKQSEQWHGALDGMADPPAPIVAEMKDTDAKLAAVTQQVAALGQQIDALSATLLQALEQQRDVLEQLLAQHETWITSGEATHPDEPFSTMLAERRLLDAQMQSLTREIADKEAEPAKIQAAAKSRVASDANYVSDAQKRMAAAQEQLKTLQGPIYVTLGEDGLALKPPAASDGATKAS